MAKRADDPARTFDKRKIDEKNRRAVARQAAKDQFMADHPELWQGGKVGHGAFIGEAEWHAFEAKES